MRTKTAHKKFEKQRFAVSNYFKELRYAENLSQSEVSAESGLHRNTIFNIENSKNFEIQTLFQLCDFYQIPASELLSIIGE
jgi:transcriptional regulator with XRE-family HTH domain